MAPMLPPCGAPQWRGLPYGEATFEKAEDIEKAGGTKEVEDMHVRPRQHVSPKP